VDTTYYCLENNALPRKLIAAGIRVASNGNAPPCCRVSNSRFFETEIFFEINFEIIFLCVRSFLFIFCGILTDGLHDNSELRCKLSLSIDPVRFVEVI
jgi:hypothetical protein